MRQAVMTSPGKIEFHDIAKIPPAAGQVLIAVQRIGVCGSDIHVYHGLHPYTSYPVVQGHEVAGVVAELGEGVTGFDIGQKVVFMPQVTCGECYPCRHGQYHICDQLKVMGFQTSGAAQDYFAVPAEMVLTIPDQLSVDEAAMIEPVSVGVHALRRFGDVNGKRVVLLGAGTIGNLTAQVAQAQGASVLITDISDYKLAKARECGLEHTLNTTTGDLKAAIRDVFGPDKADLIVECVGAQETITQAVDNARKGSTILVVGVFGKKPTVDLGLVQDRELTLVGTLMYQKVDFEQAIALAADGKLRLQPLITHRFAFGAYLQAYETIEALHGQSMKVMIELD